MPAEDGWPGSRDSSSPAPWLRDVSHHGLPSAGHSLHAAGCSPSRVTAHQGIPTQGVQLASLWVASGEAQAALVFACALSSFSRLREVLRAQQTRVCLVSGKEQMLKVEQRQGHESGQRSEVSVPQKKGWPEQSRALGGCPVRAAESRVGPVQAGLTDAPTPASARLPPVRGL